MKKVLEVILLLLLLVVTHAKGTRKCLVAALNQSLTTALSFCQWIQSFFYGWYSVKVQFLWYIIIHNLHCIFSHNKHCLVCRAFAFIFLLSPVFLQATAPRGSLHWPDVVLLKKRPSPAGGSRDLTGGCPPHTPCTTAKKGGWRNSSPLSVSSGFVLSGAHTEGQKT